MDEIRRINEKVREIRGYMTEIKERMPDSLEEYIQSDITLKRTFERNLQLINEDQMDILALLARIKDVGIVSSELNLIEKFRKILSPNTLRELIDSRALRNVLIHSYLNSKFDENVYIQASSLKKVETFLKEVEKITSKTRIER